MEGAVQGKILFTGPHEHCYSTQQLDHFWRSILGDSQPMIINTKRFTSLIKKSKAEASAHKKHKVNYEGRTILLHFFLKIWPNRDNYTIMVICSTGNFKTKVLKM